MNNKTLKYILHWLIATVVSFAVIYLFVFFGGWKLLESGDVVVLEFVAALALGTILWIFFEVTKEMENKIRQLEDRISQLEKK